MLPEVTIPEVHTYEQIFSRARERAGKIKIRAALVTPSEPDMLRALARMATEKLIDPILVGDAKLFEETCKENDIDFPNGEFIEAADPVQAVAKTAELMNSGRINLMIKGRILTGDLLMGLFLP